MGHKTRRILLGTLVAAAAAHAGTILVSSNGSGTVGAYTTSGATVNASLISGLSDPGSVTVAGSNLFVEFGGNTIGEYNFGGATVNAALITGLNNVHQITSFGSDIFVANGNPTNTIGEYTTAGATVNSALISGVNVAHGAASNGTDIFVVNNGTGNSGTGFISEFTPAGVLVNASLITGLSSPESILILNSDIFVTNFGAGTVGEYTTSGATVNAALISGLNGPTGIATDGTNLFIANSLGGTVSEYTTSGVLVNAALISGLSSPDGIAVIPQTLSAGPSQTITFDAIPNQILGVAPFAIAAQATSFLPVTLSSTAPAVCSLADDLVMLLSAGTCSIQATQGGGGSFAAASPVTRSFTVSVAKPSGSFMAVVGALVGGTGPSSVVAADFNGDGIPDLVIANSATNSVAVLLGNGSGGFTAATGSPFAVGSSPRYAVVGDFNGDGDQDLAVANYNSNNVTVLLGNGSGGFTQAPGSPFAAGTNPNSVAVGDFNGDGIQDLAIASPGSNNITVVLGNGSGGFTAATGSPFAAGSGPVSVAVGDFNGDGMQDVAVANYNNSASGNSVAVLLGNGSGGFTAALGSPFAVGTQPYSVVIGDFNGDGIPDLATANSGGNNVTVLLGNGSGGFTAAAGSPFAAGTDPLSVVVGDFNGDGIPDLATANYYSNNVTVLLGNGSGGFAAAPVSPFAVKGNGTWLAVGDFNGDGIEDLAAVEGNPATLTVLLGAVVGSTPQTITFGQPGNVTYGVAPFTVSATSTSGLVVSFASTTPTVCAVAGNTVTLAGGGTCTIIASQLGNAAYAAAATVAQSFTVNPGPQTITFPPIANQPLAASPLHLNATASSGLAVTYLSNSQNTCYVSGSLVIFLSVYTCSITAYQAGNASYDAALPVTRTFLISSVVSQTIAFDAIPSQILGASPFPILAAASSGLPIGIVSTTPPVCRTSGTLVALLSAGTCSIQATQGGNSSYTAATPVTQSFKVSRALSGGTLTAAAVSPAAGSEPYGVVVGDFNGDGIPDLAAANFTGSNVTVLLGNGLGGFTAAPGSPFTVGVNPQNLAVGDFNGDGFQDLAVTNTASSNVTVLLGNGSGGFTPASGSPFATGSGPLGVGVGDFNGDGIQDLAIANSSSNNVTILLGNGTGGFTPATGSPFAAGTTPFGLVVGDFNGDGFQDIATANSTTNNVTVLLGNGSGGFAAAPGSPFAVGTGPQKLAIGDFNGDGIPDLATGNFTSNNVTVLLGNGVGGFAQAVGSPFAAGTGPRGIAVGDFNGDGIQDLAVTDVNGGNITLLLGNGSGGFAAAPGSPFPAGGSPEGVAVADFNGDGFDDLAVPVVFQDVITILLGSQTPTTSLLSTSSPLTVGLGASVPLTLMVTDNGAAYNSLTGTVTFSDGSTVLGTAAQNGSPYTFTASGLAYGSHTLTATYSGGSGSAGSTSNAITIMVLSQQTIAFGPLGTKALSAGPVALTATASSGLQVSYTSNSPSVCMVSGSSVALLMTGQCSITASQAGSGMYAAAAPVTQTFTVTSGSQTITFDAIPNQIFGASPFPIAAQAGTGLPVVFSSTTPAVCRISDDLVMLLSAGTCSIQASSAAAAPATQSFTVGRAKPAGTFVSAMGSPFTVGTNVTSVATGDFNGDGVPDLVAANFAGNNITVLLGNGSGGFVPAAGSPIPVGTNPQSTAVGDFNGDGIRDLVVTNLGSANATVLLGNGSGGFTPAPGSPVAVGTTPTFVTVGDFNGDGVQDFAVADGNLGSGIVTVMLGNGSGGFSVAPGSPFAVGTNPQSLAEGDFNGDGVLDLAVANFGSNNVTVLLGNGSGGFAAASGSPFAAGTSPRSVVVGDFNGDGIQDLALANLSSSNVTVLLGNGSGGFVPASGSPFAVGAGPESLAVTDVNGDGFQDIETVNNNSTFSFLFGNGAGGFTAAAGNPFATGSSGVLVLAGDFNGDGIFDLAKASSTSGTVTVLLGALAPTTSVLSTTSPLTITQGQSVPLTLMVSDTGTGFNNLTGTATFSDGSTVLGTASQTTSPYTFTAASLGVGSHTLTATYGGGSGSAASTSNTITIQVNPNTTSQTITFGPLSSIPYGQGPIVLSATASSGLPVSFSSSTPGVCTLNGNVVNLQSVGTCTIMASQAGNTSYPPAASVVQSFSVTQGSQTISFSPITGAAVGSAPITLSASATSGLPVTFSSSTPAVCTVSGSSVSIVSTGTCTLTATQSGNANYLGATATQTFVVGLPTQTITFSALSNAPDGSPPFSIGAVASSGLTVVFTSNTPTVCTVSGNIVTVLTAGACSITASQGGNASYAAATPVTQRFTVVAPIVITSTTLPTGTVNQPYPAISLSATGGTGTLSWIFLAGNFPTGMSLNGSGGLSGTPTASGTFSFSVKVVDATGNSMVQALVLQINPALSITTTKLPNAIQGVAYNQKLAAAGGSGTYTWTLLSGSLPTGISLSSAGVLGGMPGVSGSFSFAAQVFDGVSSVSQTLALQVGATLSVTTSATLPSGAAGKNYSTTFAASGGTGGPYTWSVVTSAAFLGVTLPSGLTLSSTGNLSGNPSATGTFSFPVQVSDGSSPPTTLAASLTVYTPFAITTTSLANGTAGQPYTPVTFNATGGSGTVTWSASGLPTGLSLSSAGVLSGTPTAAGSSTASVKATDTVSNQTLSLPIALTVTPVTTGLKLSTSNLVVGAGAGGTLSGSLTASGGTAPYTFTATGLPAGVTLSSSGATATIGGSSATAGTFTAMVTVKDSESTPATVTAQLTIQILGLTTSPTLPAGAATVLYTASFTVAGGTPPYAFSATGLPAGLSLSGNGMLNGTVMSPGPFSFNVQTSDAAGLVSSNAYSLTIRIAPVSVPTPSLPSAAVGIPYSQTLGAIGGTKPYTWSLLSGTMPPGLSLSSAGTISGIATALGTYVFAAQATDSAGGIASASVTIGVTPAPLLFTTNSLPSGIVGFPYPQVILGATGGTPPYTFAITDGALPPGVTLANGVLGGTATTVGTFPLTITVTDSAGIQAKNVTSVVVRPPTPDLVLLASFVSFSLTTGATGLPPVQTVGVESSVVSQPLTYEVSLNPASPWLTVTTGGTTPGALTFNLTNAALSIPAGTTQTIVTLTCTTAPCQGNTQDIAVSLVVASPPPQLNVTNSLLSFTSSTTPPQAQTQPLGIQNIGGGTLAVNSITCEATWCKVGAFPAALTPGPATPVNITVDPTTLGTGFFRTVVDIASSSGSTSVPVAFFITQSASMNLAPAGTQFSMQAGGAPGNPKGSFLVTVAGGTIGWTATLLPGANWVTLNTGSGTSSSSQPGTVSYVINGNAASLTPQAYYATIEVASSGVSNSPQDYQIVLNVTPANQAAVPDPEPAGLLFLTTVGGTPPAQVVTVYSSSAMPLTYQASATTAKGGAWLTVAPAVGTTSATSPNQSTVTVSTAGLAQGVYTGGVSYAFGSIGVRTVNVTLIVQTAGGGAAGFVSGLQPNAITPKTTTPATCIPTTVVPTQTGLVDSFAAPATWPIPLQITLDDDCGNAVASGSVVATFTNGDPELALALADPVNGIYTATWTPGTSTAQVTVTANTAAPGLASAVAQINGSVVPNAVPALSQNGIVNAFNPLVGGGLAPGDVVAIYGSNLAAIPAQPTSVPLPNNINGTQVRIGGMNVPLFYVSPGQVNAQIPFELDPTKGPYYLSVTANGAPTSAQVVHVTQTNPALATYADGTLIAQHGDYSLVTQDSPAEPGETIVMYLVGMGAPTISVTDGGASPADGTLAVPPVLMLGNVPVTPAFAGLTPTAVGLYQINVQIPPGTPGGNITVSVSQNGASSNTSILPIAF